MKIFFALTVFHHKLSYNHTNDFTASSIWLLHERFLSLVSDAVIWESGGKVFDWHENLHGPETRLDFGVTWYLTCFLRFTDCDDQFQEVCVCVCEISEQC